MSTPILTTKLYVPTSRRKVVSRPHLIERLNEGQHRKMTLITAPAGYGKTTMLSEWIPQSERCVAWVSLDDGDNDPVRFWAYFVAALQMLDAEIGRNALALMQTPMLPPMEMILTTLLNEIAAFPDDFAVVLDDYHVIDAQAVDASTAADLRLTSGEAGAFLNEVMDLALSDEEIAALESRTEGWIAGLQLAALSMRGREDVHGFIEAFAGDDRYIVDYLVEEVL